MKTIKLTVYIATLFLTHTTTSSSLPQKTPHSSKDCKTITVWFYKNGCIYSRCDNKQQAEKFKKMNGDDGEVITKEYPINPDA